LAVIVTVILMKCKSTEEEVEEMTIKLKEVVT